MSRELWSETWAIETESEDTYFWNIFASMQVQMKIQIREYVNTDTNTLSLWSAAWSVERICGRLKRRQRILEETGGRVSNFPTTTNRDGKRLVLILSTGKEIDNNNENNNNDNNNNDNNDNDKFGLKFKWSQKIASTKSAGPPILYIFPAIHYRFEQDESLTKSAAHSENAIKAL